MKEKTYTFRHHKFIVGLQADIESLTTHAIKSELAQGYFPAQMEAREVMGNAFTKKGYPVVSHLFVEAPKKYQVISWYSAFMGKKVASMNYKNNPNLKFSNSVSLK